MSGSAFAQTVPTGVISPTQLSNIAKASVRHELTTLNGALQSKTPELDGYSSMQIRQLEKNHIRKISEEFAYQKCIFDADNIQTLISDELTLADDELIERSKNLSDVRENHGVYIWKLVSQLCVRSETAFEARLQTLTVGGKPLGMNAVTAKKVSQIFFYPTETGKPTFKKALIHTLYASVDAAYTIGSIQSLIGFGLGDTIVSLAFINQSMMNFMLVDLPELKSKLMEIDPTVAPMELRLDYTEEERQLVP